VMRGATAAVTRGIVSCQMTKMSRDDLTPQLEKQFADLTTVPATRKWLHLIDMYIGDGTNEHSVWLGSLDTGEGGDFSKVEVNKVLKKFFQTNF